MINTIIKNIINNSINNIINTIIKNIVNNIGGILWITVAAATLPQIICAWLTCAEINIGKVLASDTVKNNAINNSFQLKINTNIVNIF